MKYNNYFDGFKLRVSDFCHLIEALILYIYEQKLKSTSNNVALQMRWPVDG